MSANAFVVARSPVRGSRRPFLCPTFTRILLMGHDASPRFVLVSLSYALEDRHSSGGTPPEERAGGRAPILPRTPGAGYTGQTRQGIARRPATEGRAAP